MSTQKRQYKSIKENEFARTFREMLKDSDIFYFMSVDTTGLVTDDFMPEVIRVAVRKCQYKNGVMNKLGTFTSFVKPDNPIPDHITAINHVTNEDVANAPVIEDVFKQLYELMEPHANIIGYNTNKFLIPMITQCGFNTGLMFYDAKYIDLCDLSASVLDLSNAGGYRMVNVIAALKIDLPTGTAVDNVAAYEAIFNALYPMLPTGTDKATLIEERFWKKSYQCKFLYLETNRGRLSINANTLYVREETPGLFDAIDIDDVLLQLQNRHGGASIYDICKLYEKQSKVSK